MTWPSLALPAVHRGDMCFHCGLLMCLLYSSTSVHLLLLYILSSLYLWLYHVDLDSSVYQRLQYQCSSIDARCRGWHQTHKVVVSQEWSWTGELLWSCQYIRMCKWSTYIENIAKIWYFFDIINIFHIFGGNNNNYNNNDFISIAVKPLRRTAGTHRFGVVVSVCLLYTSPSPRD